MRIDEVADLVIVVRTDRRHVANLVATLDLLAALTNVLDNDVDGLLDTALDLHRVRTRGDVLDTEVNELLRQNRCRRGAVPGDVLRPRGNLFDHLGAEVLGRVFELDFLRDRHAIVGNGRAAELLVDDDVAPFRPECDFHRVGELIHTGAKLVARLGVVADMFRHFVYPFLSSVWSEFNSCYFVTLTPRRARASRTQSCARVTKLASLKLRL